MNTLLRMKMRTKRKVLALLLTVAMVLQNFSAIGISTYAGEADSVIEVDQPDGVISDSEVVEDEAVDESTVEESTEIENNPEITTAVQSETTTEAQPETTTEAQPETTTEAQPETTTAVQPETTTAAQPETTTAAQPETTTAAQPETTTAVQPETTTAAQPETTTEVQPETTTAAQPETTTAAKDLTPLETTAENNDTPINLFSINLLGLDDEDGDSEVNHALTISVGFLEAGNLLTSVTEETGSIIKAIVNLTNSDPYDTGAARTVKVNFSDLGEFVKLYGNPQNGDKYPIMLSDGNSEKDLYLEGTFVDDGNGTYIQIDVPAGATGQFTLQFQTVNGITPNGTSVTITPEIVGETKENDVCGGPATMTWTAESEWSPVEKKVEGMDSNTIAVNQWYGYYLDGILHYTITAESLTDGNPNGTGDIWTDYVTIEDTLTLPTETGLWGYMTYQYGMQFRTGTAVDGSSIVYNDENVFSFTDLQGGSVEKLEIVGNTIHFIVKVPNSCLTDGDSSDQEMNNLNLSMQLNTSCIEIYSTNNVMLWPNQIAGLKITNDVEMTPVTVTGDLLPTTKDSVNTVTLTPGEKFSVEKTSPQSDQAIKAGDVVEYTISVTNEGNAPLSANYVIVDYLPSALYLTDAQKADLIEKLSSTADCVINGNTIQITPKNAIPGVKWEQGKEPEYSKIEVTFNATVCDLNSDSIKYLNEGDTITNSVQYNGQSDSVVHTYDKPEVEFKKEGDKTVLSDGDSITYTVSLTNKETYDVNKTYTVTDTLPKGMILQDAVDADGAAITEFTANTKYADAKIGETVVCISVDGNGVISIQWEINSLPAKDEESSEAEDGITSLSYTCKLDVSKADQSSISSDGTITVSNKAKLDTNEEVSHDAVVGVGKVSIGKSADKTELKNGESITYTVTLTNTTKYDVNNAQVVTDTLPKGLILTGVKDSAGQEVDFSKIDDIKNESYENVTLDGKTVTITVDGDGRPTITWIKDTLKAEASDSLSYTCQYDAVLVDQSYISSDRTVSIKNSAKLGSGESSSWEAKGSVGELGINKELTGAKESDSENSENVSAPYEDGNVVQYTITVENNADNPYLDEVIVQDDIPAGLFPIGLTTVDGTAISDITELSKVLEWQEKDLLLNGSNVKVSNNGAAITVKWNLGKIDSDTTETIVYSAKIVTSSMGKDYAGEYDLKNTAKAAGKTDDEIIRVKVEGFDSEKKVVLADGTETDTAQLTGGATVRYVLKLKNPTSKEIVFYDDNIKDNLPAGDNLKDWWVLGTTVKVDETDTLCFKNYFAATDATISMEGNSLKWPSIKVPANTVLTQYVTLTFPDEDTLAKWFATPQNSDIIYEWNHKNTNGFVVEGCTEKTVSHTFESNAEKKFYMQKGVTKLLQKTNEYGGAAHLNEKEAFTVGAADFVEYYIVVVNTGNVNLHI